MTATEGLESMGLGLVIQDVQDTNKMRYVSAVGLVLLVYEHILTFSDAVDFIWDAPPSCAKTVFLLNRYLVPTAYICAAIFMNHFSGSDLSDLGCKIVLGMAFFMGIISIASGNVLVILRVVTLWERDHYVTKLMTIGFCISFSTSMAFTIYVSYRNFPGITYVPYLHTCVSPGEEPFLSAVWASSVRISFLYLQSAAHQPSGFCDKLIFEVMVLTLVIYNALSRPRGMNTPVRRILLRDGLLFFSAIAILRTINLIISIVAQPYLVWSGAFFIWAMTTIVLHRSLLSIHKATSQAAHARLSSTRKCYSYSRNRVNPSGSGDLDPIDSPLPDLLEATGRNTPANDLNAGGSNGLDTRGYHSKTRTFSTYRTGSLDGLRRDDTEGGFGIELVPR